MTEVILTNVELIAAFVTVGCGAGGGGGIITGGGGTIFVSDVLKDDAIFVTSC
jgi:hypothetical protein